MSDATEDPQGVAEDPSGETPYGTETALGGQTRDQYRAGSPIVAEIRRILEFHLGDNPAAGQILREVFGTIERMVMPGGVVKRPNNRPPELREWPAGAVRQLAALCRVYSFDSIPLAVPEGALDDVEPNGAPDPAEVAASIAAHEREMTEYTAGAVRTTGNGVATITTSPHPPEVAASIAAHRADVEAERAPTINVVDHTPPLIMPEELYRQVAEDTAGMREAFIEQVQEAERRMSDPFSAPAPLPPAMEMWASTAPPAGAGDPFSNPASAGHAPDGSDDGIPF